MVARTYKNAPIIEAVAEFRFEQEIASDAVNAIAKKVKVNFPNEQDVTFRELSVEVDTAKVETKDDARKKLSNDDETNTVIISPSSFSISRLAPYTTFDDLHDICSNVWDIERKVCGYRKLERIGLRYINRIDLPYINGEVKFEDYFYLRINIPEKYDSIGKYSLQFDVPLPDINCLGRIKSSIGGDVLIGHAAFFVDIDVMRTKLVPQRKNEIFALLRKMRLAKNDLFESFITDNARRIFDAE